MDHGKILTLFLGILLALVVVGPLWNMTIGSQVTALKV